MAAATGIVILGSTASPVLSSTESFNILLEIEKILRSSACIDIVFREKLCRIGEGQESVVMTENMVRISAIPAVDVCDSIIL